MNKKAVKVLVYESLKAFLMMSCVFAAIGWLTSGRVDIFNSALFGLWFTVGCIVPLGLVFKIIPPEINSETSKERKKVFKIHHVASKIILTLTLWFTLLFLILRVIVGAPLFGLTFWQALGVGSGIGLLFAVLCTLAVWFIIVLEKPPFQNFNNK